uniref:Uncharacterized protein n=1 Tax=Anguilla anguilla TaxID=7936 RepID=A0A0E9RR57_ANGAN
MKPSDTDVLKGIRIGLITWCTAHSFSTQADMLCMNVGFQTGPVGLRANNIWLIPHY